MSSGSDKLILFVTRINKLLLKNSSSQFQCSPQLSVFLGNSIRFEIVLSPSFRVCMFDVFSDSSLINFLLTEHLYHFTHDVFSFAELLFFSNSFFWCNCSFNWKKGNFHWNQGLIQPFKKGGYPTKDKGGSNHIPHSNAQIVRLKKKWGVLGVGSANGN